MSAAAWLDAASPEGAREALGRCCGARRWVENMLARRPFGDDATLERVADEVWATMDDDDVREALAHHPEIGADPEALRRRFAATAQWAAGEQAGVGSASDEVLHALADGNRRYRERFGHVFVVCATGKSAPEMLELLRARLDNEPEAELRIAAREQAAITRIRLHKLPS